jgi:hypothetical protein
VGKRGEGGREGERRGRRRESMEVGKEGGRGEGREGGEREVTLIVQQNFPKSRYSAAKAIDLAVITLRRKKNQLDFTNNLLDYPNGEPSAKVIPLLLGPSPIAFSLVK